MMRFKVWMCDGCGSRGFAMGMCPKCGGTDTCRQETARAKDLVDAYCDHYSEYALHAIASERGAQVLLPALQNIYGPGRRWYPDPEALSDYERRVTETVALEALVDILAHCATVGIDVPRMLRHVSMEHAEREK